VIEEMSSVGDGGGDDDVIMMHLSE
jgi:hypothetical protein